MLFAIVLVVFLLLQITPGDPARQVAGLRAPDEQVEKVRESLGLTDPIIVQYWRYATSALGGDLGYSYKSQQPVTEIIGERLEPTIWLMVLGTLLAILISVPLAVIAALRRDKLADHMVRGFGLVGIGMPAFWIGVMLILLVALPTGWFPVGGFGGDPLEKLRSITLPAVTLAIGSAPILIRSLRASILNILQSDYVATARSIGMPPRVVLRKFVLRNAAASTVTLLALEIGFLLFGAVVIESTFAINGVGEGIVLAARGRDMALIQGYTLMFALVVVFVYLVSDAVIAMLDPRVDIGS